MNAAAPSSNFLMTTLYVGNLVPDVNETDLFNEFSAIGPVVSIRVCRDLATRRSLGYAYVNFQQSADAERALDAMNFQLIKGWPCRIMWCQRGPSLSKSGVGNIFIQNLDKNIGNKALYVTFSTFGNILSCRNEVSKGFGYVHFETQEAADEAVEKVNGMLLNDKLVHVFLGKWVPRKERLEQLDDQLRKFTIVCVKNLAEDFAEEDLKKLFEPFGEIQSMKIMRDEDGRSKCFGFVSFVEPESARQACVAVQERADLERQAELRRHLQQQRMERINQFQCANLYLENLEESIDDARLSKEFESYGTITSAKVMKDDEGNSKDATKAVTEKNGQIVMTKALYVALAQSNEERLAQFPAQHMPRVAGRMTPQGFQPVGQMFAAGFYPAMATFPPGQRPPFLAPQVVRTRFAPQVVRTRIRGQPAYPGQVVNRPRMPRAITRPITHNQQQSRVGPTGAMPCMGGQRNKYRPVVNQAEAGQQPPTPAGITLPGQDMLNPSLLAEASTADKLSVIQQTHLELAGKIIDILLEIDDAEMLQMTVIHLLEFREALADKVEETVSVLNARQAWKQTQEPKK